MKKIMTLHFIFEDERASVSPKLQFLPALFNNFFLLNKHICVSSNCVPCKTLYKLKKKLIVGTNNVYANSY